MVLNKERRESKLVKSTVPLVVLFIHRDCFGVSCSVLSNIMELDGTQSAQKIHLNNSTAVSLPWYHELATQDNSQTLLWAVLCRKYFLSTQLHLAAISLRRRKEQGLWIILSNQVMISGETMLLSYSHICLWHTRWVQFGSITQEKADVSTADISRTLQLTPTWWWWINSTTGKREKSVFLILGRTVPLRQCLLKWFVVVMVTVDRMADL